VYPAALFKEWMSVEASNAFIYADVNTYCPITPADRREKRHREERHAATHGDVKASCTTTTSK
jgi:hypothetical protein